MPIRHGVCGYPGILGVVNASYTASHSVTPGIITIVCQPQSNVIPAYRGPVVFSDGEGGFILDDCRLTSIRSEVAGTGELWTVTLEDERWKWVQYGRIDGEYNQLDQNGKLIPWMVRSPQELAVLCFEAMGWDRYVIDLPVGITQQQADQYVELLQPGELFPPTSANPPIKWDAEIPALALTQIAEMFGRRFVFDPISRRILIVKPGIGSSLPEGSRNSFSPSITPPAVPDSIVVVGSETKYQARFSIEPYGEEWNGVLKPINELSYAPTIPGLPQISAWQVSVPDDNGKQSAADAGGLYFEIQLSLPALGQPDASNIVHTFQYEYIFGDNANDVMTALKSQIDGNSDCSAVFTTSIVLDGLFATLLMTGKRNGIAFEIVFAGFIMDGENEPEDFTSSSHVIQAAGEDRRGWDYCPPPLFPTVVATDRLTKEAAIAKAQKCIWRVYRLTGQDVSGEGEILIPGYGRLKRRQQVCLLETKVDQITPEQVDFNVRDKQGRPIVVNFYNGYSRDKPSICLGAVARDRLGAIIMAKGEGFNSPAGSQVFIDFSVNREWQSITFQNYCYFLGTGGTILDPELILEAGCHVRDSETNQLVCYSRTLELNRSGTNAKIGKHPDVQLNVTCDYDENNNPQNVRLLEDDAVTRANYYLAGHAAQFFTEEGLNVTYNGLEIIPLDGAIQQVTWTIQGGEGCMTQASRNSEHSIYVPPYPTRRRAESLNPAANGAGAQDGPPKTYEMRGDPGGFK